MRRHRSFGRVAVVENLVGERVDGSGGRVEVVGQLVRRVTFDMLTEYFGIPEPAQGRLDVWATRLFEFQFASSPKDRDLRKQVEKIAPAFRAHIDREIGRRKVEGDRRDDVLGRCLALQAAGELGFSDVQIRTAILCMIVGGPPQPPMVVPQAMEQLLRRPDALAAACDAARADEDEKLHRMVMEAMRFDPLAPGLPRIAAQNAWVARGTHRGRAIPEGSTVIAAFASAMMDPRASPRPNASIRIGARTNTSILAMACTSVSAVISTAPLCIRCSSPCSSDRTSAAPPDLRAT